LVHEVRVQVRRVSFVELPHHNEIIKILNQVADLWD